MRKNIKKFVAVAASTLPHPGPIIEFGAYQVDGQLGHADLRPLFPGREYLGADMREGPGVDRVLDLHHIDLPSDSVGSVLCFDTLEHVEDPRLAMQEIHRILSPAEGMVVISSVMNFYIHDFPHDYWRFTPYAFESILKPFKHSFVGFAGKEDFPHTVVGVGFKGEAPDLTGFKEKYEKWQKDQKYEFKQIVRQLVPPILLSARASIYKKLAG